MAHDALQVLLVEDKLGEARLFCAGLEESAPDQVEVKVEHASRLRDATGRLATTHYDAILLDLSLPDSHGIETVQRIHEGATDTPIIVLTGTDDGRVAAESLSLGAQDYLVKDAADAPSLRRALRYAIERKRAERALRKAHDELDLRVRDRTAELAARTQLLSSILSNIPHRVFWKNKDSVYLGCNENFAKDAGLASPDEIIGKTDYDLAWTREHADHYRRADFQVMELDRPMLNVEEPDHRLDGKQRWRLTSRVTLKSHGGEVVGILGLFVDITDRKLVEKELRETRDAAQAATRVKSEFLATMSHELRTPLSGMLGTVGLLLQTELNAEQRRYAGLAQAAGDTLLALINDVLDFSKIDAGKLELESADFDLHAMIQNVADILLCKAEGKGLSLTCDIHPGVPRRVRGDSNRLTQVLINLVGNAVKFTEAGGVIVRVTPKDGTPAQVHFEVTDTGIGIPEARLHRLFQTFFQVDASTTRKYGGTGLGLAISERLVTAMRGTIGVTSTPGIGSTFWFTIPFAQPAIEPGPVTTGVDESTPSQGAAIKKSARILLAEDYEINRIVLKDMLTKAGYRCDVVSNGVAAVQAAKVEHYDLILMDCQMPEMDGFEATRLIRGSQPSRGWVPIIALTAGVMADDRERCLQAGMDDYVTKPVTPARLLEVVRSHLVRASLQDAVGQSHRT